MLLRHCLPYNVSGMWLRNLVSGIWHQTIMQEPWQKNQFIVEKLITKLNVGKNVHCLHCIKSMSDKRINARINSIHNNNNNRADNVRCPTFVTV